MTEQRERKKGMIINTGDLLNSTHSVLTMAVRTLHSAEEEAAAVAEVEEAPVKDSSEF